MYRTGSLLSADVEKALSIDPPWQPKSVVLRQQLLRAQRQTSNVVVVEVQVVVVMGGRWRRVRETDGWCVCGREDGVEGEGEGEEVRGEVVFGRRKFGVCG